MHSNLGQRHRWILCPPLQQNIQLISNNRAKVAQRFEGNAEIQHVWCRAHDNQSDQPTLATDGSSLEQTSNACLVDIGSIARAALLATVVAGAAPECAWAAELLPSQLADIFRDWVNSIEALGPWGPLLFVATVASAEMVPFLPTQPFSLASGLIFGAKEGAVLMLVALTLAATNAYYLARGVGRPLAERIVKAEMSGEGEKGNVISRKLSEVNQVIESGTIAQQLVAIVILRLTPIVPYSASNYVLGASPIKYPIFIVGTAAGMAVWAAVFASIGAAGRAFLAGGDDIADVLGKVGEQASEKSQLIGEMGLIVAAVVAAAYAVGKKYRGAAKQSAD